MSVLFFFHTYSCKDRSLTTPRDAKSSSSHCYFSDEDAAPEWLKALGIAKKFIAALDEADAMNYSNEDTDEES